ncbi:unnamed protein product, partial [Didymodactylos carnosus]
ISSSDKSSKAVGSGVRDSGNQNSIDRGTGDRRGDKAVEIEKGKL